MSDPDYSIPPHEPETITIPPPPSRQPRKGKHLLLFLITLFTTLFAGVLWNLPEEYYDSSVHILWFSLTHLYLGIPYSFTLMAILGAHEMGHYLMCRRYRIDTTLPYFLPFPPVLGIGIGTFGAFIRIKSPIPDRKALFDVGIAGPLAGMLVAIPAMFIGLYFSEFQYQGIMESELQLGEPLFLKAISYILFGLIPGTMDIYISPMAFAAWLGFLVTFLNLIPIGQLDGGHIIYAIFGKHHARIGRIMFLILVLFGFIFRSMHWFIWAIVILLLLGVRHPRPVHMRGILGWKRICLAIIALIVLMGTFIHNPIEFHPREQVPYEDILKQSI